MCSVPMRRSIISTRSTTVDIVDCNAGDHGHPFATNFNPEINIREITQKGKYWENGQWIEIDPMSIRKDIDYPEVGPKASYLLYHEELESLVKHIKGLKRIRFWMTFGEAVPHAPARPAECRHDPHRPGGVRGPQDRAAASFLRPCCRIRVRWESTTRARPASAASSTASKTASANR